MPLKSLSKVSVGASGFNRLPNGFKRSSKLTQTMPIDGDNVASIRVVIGTTAVGTSVFNRSATVSTSIGVSASGQQTDQQHYGTATVGVVISSTASASVTSTHSGTATASIVITATAAGETGATHAGTANIGVTISATASGTASQTHAGVASCQVNLSVSASGFNTNTTVPDETSNGNNMTLYADGSGTKYAYSSDAAIGTRSVEFEGSATTNGTGGYGIIDNTFQSVFRSSFSISAWVKLDDGDRNYNWILGNYESGGDGGNDNRIALYFQGGDPAFYYKSGTVAKLAWDLDYDLANGQSGWIHLVGTYNATDDNMYLYVNGTEAASNTTSVDPTQYTNSVNLRVNKYEDSNSDYIYTGKKIDDISIWSKALSSTEVSNIYNSGNGSDLSGSSDLEGWWKMGDHSVLPVTHSGTATVSVDVTASASGETFTTHSGTASCQVNLSASASGTVVAGYSNSYSLDFDGTDDYLEVSDHDDLSFGNSSTDSAFTMAGWVKLDSTSLQRFITKSTSSTAEYIFGTGSGSNLLLALYDDTTSVVRYRLSTATLSTGLWTHVAVTHSGGTIKLFINGSEDSGTSGDIGSYTAMHNSTGTVRLGAYENSSQYTNGKLDELAIWDEALTSAEITAMYNSGSPLNLATDSGNYASSANLTAWWRLENNTNDSSGNGHNGTVSSSPTFSTDVPVFNQFSISLDGSNDYVDLGNPSALQITGDMSIGMWFKTSSGSANRLIAKDGGGGQPRQYVLLLLNNKLRWVRFNSSGTLFTIDSVDTYNDNAWHHVVVTNKSTGTIDMFVDGVQLTEGTGSGNYTVETTNGDDGITMNNASVDIEIGYFAQANSQYFNGLIDEVAIWNDALTASEVTKIYNSGSPINIGSNDGNYTSASNLQGWWRFEENTGTSIADSSSNSNSATLVNGPTFSTTTP